MIGFPGQPTPSTMSVLSPPWPSRPPPWNGHSAASFSALAAPVIPPIYPSDSPFPSPTHGYSVFSALAASPPLRWTHPQINHHQPPVAGPSAFGGFPQRNTRSLDRDALVQILTFLSNLLPARFGNGQQIRLVIHGGAVMLLNADLAQLAAATATTDGRAKRRTTTRDIDYIARSFSSEWAQRYGVYDANDRLKQCIFETALQFGLGADWMNSDADVALPMATDPTTGAIYDPIHAASIQTGESLTVYTSPNGLLKLVSVTSFWAVALKMVRYNPVDREDICILLRSGTQMRQLHWTPARLEIWLLGTCWAMGYAGYDHERIKEMRRRMIEVVAEVNRWDPHAVTDDGRGGVVPLRPESGAYPPGIAYRYGYTRQPNPIYDYHRAIGASVDPRMSTTFHSSTHSPRSYTFPPSGSSTSFFLEPAPTSPPPPPPKNKKTKKKTKMAAVTTWPNQWTCNLPSNPPQQWDPESPELWGEGVWRAAAKERKHGHMTSWIPFLKNTESQSSLKLTRYLRRRQYYNSDEDSNSHNSDSDSDSDDSDWLRREQLKWGTTGRGPHVAGIGGGFQHNVADFMSNGMTPIAAPTVMSLGPGHGQPVLPGWNVSCARSQPQLLRSWLYPGSQERQRSPPVRQVQPGPDMNQIAAGMNVLGLYNM